MRMRFSALMMTAADCSSTLASGSSSSRTGRLSRNARARERRFCCPPDMFKPSSTNSVSRPRGSLRTKSAMSTSANASQICSSGMMLSSASNASRSVPENKYACCSVTETFSRNVFEETRDTGMPSRRISPAVGVNMRSSSDKTVLFPEPLAPISRVRRFGRRVMLSPFSTNPLRSRLCG